MKPAPYITGRQGMQKTARSLYEEFLPWPRLHNLTKNSPFILSVIFGIITVMEVVNIFVENPLFSDIIWISFSTWVILFFAYLIFRIIFQRKKFKLFQTHNPHDAQYL